MDRAVLEALRTELRPLGFRTRRKSFYRTTDAGLYIVLSVQDSAWAPGGYLNVGYADESQTNSGWLPDSKCQVRFRSAAIRSLAAHDVDLALDPESNLSEERRFDLLVDELIPSIVPLLVLDDWSDLREAMRSTLDGKRVFVHQGIRSRIEGRVPPDGGERPVDVRPV